MNDADDQRISVERYRNLTNDNTSSTEQIEQLVNSLYELSLIVYNNNSNE